MRRTIVTLLIATAIPAYADTAAQRTDPAIVIAAANQEIGQLLQEVMDLRIALIAAQAKIRELTAPPAKPEEPKP